MSDRHRAARALFMHVVLTAAIVACANPSWCAPERRPGPAGAGTQVAAAKRLRAERREANEPRKAPQHKKDFMATKFYADAIVKFDIKPIQEVRVSDARKRIDSGMSLFVGYYSHDGRLARVEKYVGRTFSFGAVLEYDSAGKSKNAPVKNGLYPEEVFGGVSGKKRDQAAR